MLRATQEYVSVIFGDTPSMRTTQEYVAVLFGETPFVRITQNYISVLTRAPDVVTRDVNQQIGLSQDPDLPNPFPVCSNSFALSQDPYLPNPYPVCSNNFAFVSFSTRYYQQTETIVQLLGFTRRVIVSAGNAIWLDKLPTPGVPPTGSIVNQVIPHDVNNEFEFSQPLNRAYAITNALGLTDEAIREQTLSAYNEFGFSSEVNAADTEFDRDSAQHCLRQSLSFRVSGPNCPEKNYAPAVGSGGDPSFEAMETTPPTITHTDMILTFPVVMPSITLALKNPEFGNVDRLQFSVISRENRGGDKIVYIDPDWPITEILEFSIVNLCEIEPLLEFINATIGQEIGLLDWENQQWKGVIIAPNTQLTQAKTGWSIKLQFQGVKI